MSVPPWHPEYTNSVEETQPNHPPQTVPRWGRLASWGLLAAAVIVACMIALASTVGHPAPPTTTGPVSVPGGAAPGAVPKAPVDPYYSDAVEEE